MTTDGISRQGSIAFSAILVAAAALMLPAPALAGKLRGGSSVSFSASSGERNHVMVLTGSKAQVNNPNAARQIAEITDFGAPVTHSATDCFDGPNRKVEGSTVEYPTAACNSKRPKVNVNLRGEDDFAQAKGESAVVLNGGGGNDELIADNALDRLLGGAGDDQLMGGGGEDIINAGSGDDEIDANDGGARDRINCGPGYDVVYTDLDENGMPTYDNLKGCEDWEEPRVSFSGDEDTSVQDTEAYYDDYFTDVFIDDSEIPCAAVVAINRAAKVSRKGTTSVKLLAPGNATYSCTGTVRLDVTLRSKRKKARRSVKAKHRRRGHRVRIGIGYFIVDPGKTAKAKIFLSRRGERLIAQAKKRRLRVRLTVLTDQDTSQDASASTISSSKSLTLKEKKPRRAKRLKRT